VASRVRQWLLDPGRIYQAISAWLPEPSAQQRLVARAAEIGRQWSELTAGAPACGPHCADRAGRGARRSGRHSPAPATAQRAIPCRCTVAEHTRRGNRHPVRAGTAAQSRDGNQDADRRDRSVRRGETRRTIDQAAPQTRRFNATLVQSDGIAFAALALCEGVSRSYFSRIVRGRSQ